MNDRNYMGKNLNQTFEAKREVLQKQVRIRAIIFLNFQIDMFEGKSLETLNIDELKRLKTTIFSTLSNIKKIKKESS